MVMACVRPYVPCLYEIIIVDMNVVTKTSLTYSQNIIFTKPLLSTYKSPHLEYDTSLY